MAGISQVSSGDDRRQRQRQIGRQFQRDALCLDAAARGQGVAIGDDISAMHLSEGRLVRPFDSDFFQECVLLCRPQSKSEHAAVDTFSEMAFRERSIVTQNRALFTEAAANCPVSSPELALLSDRGHSKCD